MRRPASNYLWLDNRPSSGIKMMVSWFSKSVPDRISAGKRWKRWCAICRVHRAGLRSSSFSMIQSGTVPNAEIKSGKAPLSSKGISGAPIGAGQQKNVWGRSYSLNGESRRRKRKIPNQIASITPADFILFFDDDFLDSGEDAETCVLQLLNESGEIFLEEAVDLVQFLIDRCL